MTTWDCAGCRATAFLPLQQSLIDFVKSSVAIDLTPLMTAVLHEHFACLQTILTTGADVNMETPLSALSIAIATGNLQLCQLLLDSGALVKPNGKSVLPLHLACSLGSLKICELLIRRGAQTNLMNDIRQTPLHHAASSGFLDCCELLISNDAVVNGSDDNLITPLHLSARNGHAPICRLLLSKDANVNAFNKAKQTPLHEAFEHSQVECCVILIKAGANVNLRNYGSMYRSHPLEYVVACGHVDLCRLLLEHKADANAFDQFHTSMLNLASKAGFYDCCQLLIEAGAVVNTRDAALFMSPLCNSAAFGHASVCQLLVNNSADLELPNLQSKTPLILACEKGSFECCEILIRAGAKVNAVDSFLQTPLILAAGRGSPSICELLIKAGANIHHRSKNSNTALFEAVTIRAHGTIPLGSLPCCQLLLVAGADVNATNDAGESVLHIVARQNNHEHCALFIQNGACVNNFDHSRHTALSLAVRLNCGKCTQLLMENGSSISLRLGAQETSLLHLAISRRNLELVKKLVQKGAAVNFSQHDLITPIMVAAELSMFHCLEYLLHCGADPDLHDIKGNDLLHFASAHSPRILKFLLLEVGMDEYQRSYWSILRLRNAHASIFATLNEDRETYLQSARAALESKQSSMSIQRLLFWLIRYRSRLPRLFSESVLVEIEHVAAESIRNSSYSPMHTFLRHILSNRVIPATFHQPLQFLGVLFPHYCGHYKPNFAACLAILHGGRVETHLRSAQSIECRKQSSISSELLSVDLIYSDRVAKLILDHNATTLIFVEVPSVSRLTDFAFPLSLSEMLVELQITGTRLTEMPTSIRCLTNLETLKLCGNDFVRLPEWIGSLTLLQQLDISHNLRLHDIPTTALQLKGITKFSAVKTLLFDELAPELWQGKEGFHLLQAVILAHQKARRIYRCRLMLVGDGESGKTSLRHALAARETPVYVKSENDLFGSAMTMSLCGQNLLFHPNPTILNRLVSTQPFTISTASSQFQFFRNVDPLSAKLKFHLNQEIREEDSRSVTFQSGEDLLRWKDILTFVSNPEPQRTAGATVGELHLSRPASTLQHLEKSAAEADTIELTTWDLAGQAEYWWAHRLYLDSRCVYVFLWDTLKPDGFARFQEWFMHILNAVLREFHSDDGVYLGMLIVANKTEHASIAEQTALLARARAFVECVLCDHSASICVDYHCCSIHSGNVFGVSEIENKLFELASRMKHMGELAPAWLLRCESAVKHLHRILPKTELLVTLSQIQHATRTNEDPVEVDDDLVRFALPVLQSWSELLILDSNLEHIILRPKQLVHTVVGQLIKHASKALVTGEELSDLITNVNDVSRPLLVTAFEHVGIVIPIHTDPEAEPAHETRFLLPFKLNQIEPMPTKDSLYSRYYMLGRRFLLESALAHLPLVSDPNLGLKVLVELYHEQFHSQTSFVLQFSSRNSSVLRLRDSLGEIHLELGHSNDEGPKLRHITLLAFSNLKPGQEFWSTEEEVLMTAFFMRVCTVILNCLKRERLIKSFPANIPLCLSCVLPSLSHSSIFLSKLGHVEVANDTDHAVAFCSDQQKHGTLTSECGAWTLCGCASETGRHFLIQRGILERAVDTIIDNIGHLASQVTQRLDA